MKPPVIAIDFDRVIHDIDHPIEGRKMGGPMPGAGDALADFAANDIIVDVFTVRAATEQGRTVVEEWMRYYELPYRYVTAHKQKDWKMIVDDLAFPFSDWGQHTRHRIIVMILSSVAPQQKPNKPLHEEPKSMHGLAEDEFGDVPSSEKFLKEYDGRLAKSAKQNSVGLLPNSRPPQATCSFCHGAGTVQAGALGNRRPCAPCNGTGKVRVA